jgi:DNA-binding response OmpR family regulator
MTGSHALDTQARRILVCEDDAATAWALGMILTDAGYTVIGPARTAEQALQEAYSQTPDVALIDIGLSGMIDGISVAGELAPLGIPVIFLTGDYRRAMEEARELAVDILIKPIEVVELLRTVSAALDRRDRSRRDDPVNALASSAKGLG